MNLNRIFEQVLNETLSLDELFIQGLNLCIKAEKCIVNAIVNACKPFALNEADNTNINNVTDNIAIEAINNADILINHINGVITSLNTRDENLRREHLRTHGNNEGFRPQFTNPRRSRLAHQQFLRNIQEARQELNDENLVKELMEQIEESLRNRIKNKQNELISAEEKLTEIFNTYS